MHHIITCYTKPLEPLRQELVQPSHLLLALPAHYARPGVLHI